MKKPSAQDMYWIESYVLKWIDFALLDELRKDLWPTYMITTQDINLLIMLNSCYSIKWKKETMNNVLNLLDRLHKDKDERDVLYWMHCDPYELFIDAWWIDKKLNVLY